MEDRGRYFRRQVIGIRRGVSSFCWWRESGLLCGALLFFLGVLAHEADQLVREK